MPTQDILVSDAKLFYAPVGEPLPDETSVGAGEEWGDNWVHLGDTLTPTEVNLEVETFDLRTEQKTAPVRQVITGRNVSFGTTLAELTNVNLGLAFDGSVVTVEPGASQAGFGTISVDPEKTQPSMYAFGLEGKRLTDDNELLAVRVFIPRGTLRLSGAMTFARGAGLGLPVTITALAQTGQSLVMLQNITAPATGGGD